MSQYRRKQTDMKGFGDIGRRPQWSCSPSSKHRAVPSEGFGDNIADIAGAIDKKHQIPPTTCTWILRSGRRMPVQQALWLLPTLCAAAGQLKQGRQITHSGCGESPASRQSVQTKHRFRLPATTRLMPDNPCFVLPTSAKLYFHDIIVYKNN